MSMHQEKGGIGSKGIAMEWRLVGNVVLTR